MTRATPWADIDGCIAVLSKRRDVLVNQIAALESLKLKTDDRDVQLILRYTVIGSMKGTAQWARDQGWTLPGATGNQRQYTEIDIKALLEKPPECVGGDLIRLIYGIFNANSQQVSRSYG